MSATPAMDQAISNGDRIPESLFSGLPVIRPNPQKRVPLVAIIDTDATIPVTAEIEIQDEVGHQWTVQGNSLPAQNVRLIAHGMRPDRLHHLTVKLTDPVSQRMEKSKPLEFRTPPLPDSFPPLEVTLADKDRVEPGVTIFPVNLWRNDQSMMNYGYLIAVDESGEVVWLLRSGHRTADLRRLSNGHMLYQHGNYRYAFEIDLLGNIVRQWHASRLTPAPTQQSIPVDIDTMHHEIVEHPNGNFFTLSTHLIEVDKFPTSVNDPGAAWESAHVVTDHLIEFNPDTGEVVRRIDLRKFLDPDRFGYLSLSSFWKPKYDKRIDSPSRDWSHANGLVLLPEEDAVIVSFRHLDCLIKIDLATESIRWIFGTPEGWSEKWHHYFLKPDNSQIEWPAHQHSPQILANGNLRLYDNGNYRARPFEKPVPTNQNRSRIVEYEINEKEKSVRQVWQYDGSPDNTFFCPFYCEADSLPQTGNLMVTNGGHIELEDGTPFAIVPGERQWANIFEVTSDSEPDIVFNIQCASPIGSPFGWSIYRSMKLSSLNELQVRPENIPAVIPQQLDEADDSESPEDGDDTQR